MTMGMDLSKEMLEIGRTKVLKKGLDKLITLEQGDSENLRYEDNTFGQLVVLEFSRPTIFPFKQLFNAYFKYILPLIGRVTSKDPKAYQYLYESVQAFPDGEDFLKVLNKTGFKSYQCRKLSLGICSIYSGFK